MFCSVCNSQNADNATACRSCGSPLTAAVGGVSASALRAGTKLDAGTFTVGRVLGQGGFGITYLGADTSLGRPVAIKEFFPQGCTRQGTTVYPCGTITLTDYNVARQRFLEEARVLAQFHHRGIVGIYSIVEANNTAYMVMEFVKGATLQKLVDTRGPLPEREVVNYITQAADALTAVHEAKLLHRDIKPENLMVTQDGRVVLVDFGTARAFASGKTRRMTAMLTPGYAPLEQYGQQARFGVFTDLYALGATCYHLLTGQMPVQATDRATGVELRSPHRLNRTISETVSDAVVWAMEMRSDRRPQSAQEFVDAMCGRFFRTHGDNQVDSLSGSEVSCRRCATTISNAFVRVDGHPYCPRCFRLVSQDTARRFMGVALSQNETACFYLRGHRLLGRHSEGGSLWSRVDAGTFLVTNQRILFVASRSADELWERPLLHLRNARVERLGRGTGIDHDSDPILVLEFFGCQETNGFYVGDTMTLKTLPRRLQRLQVQLGASGGSVQS